MFDGYALTVHDILTMIIAFCLRFQISNIARLELINMVKYFAGPKYKHFNISNYDLSKLFNPPDDKTVYHYYCNSCTKNILYSTSEQKYKKQTIICDKCQEKHVITLKSTNYFTSINLQYQLKILLSNEQIKSEILNDSVMDTNN